MSHRRSEAGPPPKRAKGARVGGAAVRTRLAVTRDRPTCISGCALCIGVLSAPTTASGSAFEFAATQLHTGRMCKWDPVNHYGGPRRTLRAGARGARRRPPLAPTPLARKRSQQPREPTCRHIWHKEGDDTAPTPGPNKHVLTGQKTRFLTGQIIYFFRRDRKIRSVCA